jgi:hypothetical protein
MLVSPQGVLANVADRVEHETRVTAGSKDGKAGHWVDVYESLFRWIPAPPISDEDRRKYIDNHPYDGITDWQWAWGNGVNPYKGDRDWNMSELVAAFGGFGWKSGQAAYGWNGLNAAIAPQTSRNLGQAYRFLKLAEMMEQNGIASIPDPLIFSIQADDGVGWDYSGQNYVNVNPSTHLDVLPNIQSEFFLGNTTYNMWTSVRRFTITDLTPQLARQIAEDLYSIATRCGSPIALDLNRDGILSVTGKSSAKERILRNNFVAEGAVRFDLEAVGRKPRYEWLKGGVDAFLVNDRDGKVSRAVAKDGEVDGSILFGNAGGYENGYFKLAKFFDNGAALASGKGGSAPDGVLKGKELEGLKLWADTNQDGKVQANELKTLASLGITEIGSAFKYERNADGELLMRSHYVANGKRYVTEDVWFAIDPADQPGGKK